MLLTIKLLILTNTLHIQLSNLQLCYSPYLCYYYRLYLNLNYRISSIQFLLYSMCMSWQNRGNRSRQLMRSHHLLSNSSYQQQAHKLYKRFCHSTTMASNQFQACQLHRFWLHILNQHTRSHQLHKWFNHYLRLHKLKKQCRYCQT